MNKILLIIQREYLTRVKKKSFILMTILGPVLMAALVILPAFLADWSEATHKRVAVLDETGWFFEKFKDQENVTFYYVVEDLQAEKEEALYKRGDMLLYIPSHLHSFLHHVQQPKNVQKSAPVGAGGPGRGRGRGRGGPGGRGRGPGRR